MKKKKIAVLYGGTSSEREISLRSGENVYNALINKGYNAVKIDLDKNIVFNLKQEAIEFVYIILHGSPGEDGKIQGLLDIMDIQYAGSGVLGNAAALNKIVTKQLFSANNIPTPDFIVIDKDYNFNNIIKLGFPLIYKPCSEGSSVGVVKIDTEEDLKNKLPDLVKKYKHGLIEKFIKGRDITIGVIDDNGETIAMPILELISENEFYDYDAKYTHGKTKFIVPAKIDKYITKKAQDLALKAHKALWCENVSRVDMITADNDLFILEVNTIPGMTNTSDLPAEAKAMGMEFDDLVEKILLSGYAKYE